MRLAGSGRGGLGPASSFGMLLLLLLLLPLVAATMVLLLAPPTAHAFLLQPQPHLGRAVQATAASGRGGSILAGTRSRRGAAAAVAMSASTDDSSTTGKQKKRPQVVVAGGGFGGLYSALRLAELAREGQPPSAGPAVDITLVDRSDRFVFLPLLYELAVGDAQKDEVAPQFRTLLASTGIRFLQGEITRVDAEGRSVALTALGTEASREVPKEQARTLAYDRLVLALGSEPFVPALPSSSDKSSSSMTFYRLEDAERLSHKLEEMERRGARGAKGLFRVVIVGGGYSGVELAANLAARLGRDRGAVTLVDRGFSILHNSPDHVRAAANKRLIEEGVEVLLGVDVLDATESTVTLRDKSQVSADVVAQQAAAGAPEAIGGVAVGTGAGEGAAGAEAGNIVLPADLIVWTAGAGVNPLVKTLSGFEQDARGRVKTTQGLRAKGATRDVYVVGDNAAVEGYEDALPSTAQVAFQQSEIAAWNIWSSLCASAPGPLQFRYTPLGEMLTLGPMDAAVSGLRGLFQLEGPPASLARRLVYVMRMPTGGQRLRAAKSWVQTRAAQLKGQLRGALDGGAGGGV